MTPRERTSSAGSSKRPGQILVALLAWGALAFGAVYPWAYWPLAAGCTLLGTWAVLKSEPWRDPRSTALAVALIAIALAIVVQLIPLPSGIVGWISPARQTYFERYEFGYQAPTFQPLSISPAITLTTLALFLSFAILLVGLGRALRGVTLEWLVHALMGLGVTLALIGIIQKPMVDDAHPLVYGFWKPRDGGNVFGPFVNRNHFAGWMVMALPIVIGYSCGVVGSLRLPHRRGLSDWLHWAVSVQANRFLLGMGATLVMASALVLTQSRSGMLGFAVGVAVVALFIVARATKPMIRAAALFYCATLVVGAVVWAGASTTVNRIAAAPNDIEGRLSVWHDTTTIIRDFPVTGTGLGTFGQAMLVYQTGRRDLMYAQAHNDYLQLAAEGGILVVIPAIVAIVLLVRAIQRRLAAADDDVLTSWVRVGAVAGLAGIAVQSLMEFSLQMPGNAMMFVVVAALAMHRPRRSGRANRI